MKIENSPQFPAGPDGDPSPQAGCFGTVAVWLRAMRIQFLQASLLPVALGSALAVRDGAFSWGLFWAAALAIGAIHLGTNLANDYYDHLSGADERNPNPTRFSGGSRVIQEKRLSPDDIFNAAAIFYALGILLGIYLIFRTDWRLAWFGVPGVILSFFYTATPLKLGYRGWGELLVGILLGPAAVMGAYYVYTGTVTAQSFFLSLPLGLLVSAILYINQFPDAESDAASGKLHWIARRGREKAVGGYRAIIGATYFGILLPVSLNILPAWTLLALLTFPMAARAAQILRRAYGRTEELLPAMGLTIGTHLVTGLLLFIGLMLDYWKIF